MYADGENGARAEVKSAHFILRTSSGGIDDGTGHQQSGTQCNVMGSLLPWPQCEQVPHCNVSAGCEIRKGDIAHRLRSVQ